MLLYRIPFLDFPVLDVWLGDCCIPISIYEKAWKGQMKQ